MSTLTEALLDPLLAADPKGPRITYYDDGINGADMNGAGMNERIELSTVTLANWAAKTANLLREELGAGPSSRVAVLLPAHWQTVAVLLGVWWIGAEVVLTPRPADIALCTADRLAEADAAVDGGEVAVLSLDPFGAPVPDLPVGLTDYATAVRGHGDAVAGESTPGPALDGRSVGEVLAEARRSAASRGLTAADRVMSDQPWSTPTELIDNLLAVLAAGGSLVQLSHPDPNLIDRRRTTEKVTRTIQ